VCYMAAQAGLDVPVLASLRERLVSLSRHSQSLPEEVTPDFFRSLEDCVQHLDVVLSMLEDPPEIPSRRGPRSSTSSYAPSLSTRSSIAEAVGVDTYVDHSWLRRPSDVTQKDRASHVVPREGLGPEGEKTSWPVSPLSPSVELLPSSEKTDPSPSSSALNFTRTLAAYRLSQSSVVGRIPGHRNRSPAPGDVSDDDLYCASYVRQLVVPESSSGASSGHPCHPQPKRRSFSTALREAVSANASSEEVDPSAEEPTA
jgi:hypothetical protein